MDLLERYIHEHTEAEEALLHELDCITHQRMVAPRMLSGRASRTALTGCWKILFCLPLSTPLVINLPVESVINEEPYPFRYQVPKVHPSENVIDPTKHLPLALLC